MSSLVLLLVPLLGVAGAVGLPVVHGALQVLGPREVAPTERPLLALAVPDRPATIHLECQLGGKPFQQTSGLLPAGTAMEVLLPAAPPVSSAECVVVANFANGLSERRPVSLAWTWLPPPPPEGAAEAPTGADGAPTPAPTGSSPAAPAPGDPPPPLDALYRKPAAGGTPPSEEPAPPTGR